MSETEVPIFQTPPVQSQENQPTLNDVLTALKAGDGELKGKVLVEAQNLLARVSKRTLIQQLDIARIPYKRSMSDRFKWAEGTFVRTIHDAIAIRATEEEAYREALLAFDSFLAKIELVSLSPGPEPRPVILLDALNTNLQEVHESGVYSISWKQRVAVGVEDG